MSMMSTLTGNRNSVMDHRSLTLVALMQDLRELLKETQSREIEMHRHPHIHANHLHTAEMKKLQSTDLIMNLLL